MANDQLPPPEKIQTSEKDQEEILEECVQHESSSYTYLSTVRKDWDDKESMLLGYRPEDKASQQTKAKIFNPILSEMIMERASRVMANAPMGQAFAVSRSDVGKNMLMNMLFRYFQGHANEEGSHLLKLRQMDVYSHVYGTQFGLVPWRVNRVNNYIGPELLPINMRDCRPQPGKRTIDKSDWFGVRSVISMDWLRQQDKKTWINIDSLLAEMKERKDPGEDQRADSKNNRSYVERMRYPSRIGDQVFPAIEIFTEYRYDKWITWAPKMTKNDNAKAWVLRVVNNPYPKGYLPIIAKHAFPLLDSLIGLGDFERGKTLQFAINSLINLYLDGVKYAIFPPLHINLDEVDAQSIKWGAGEKWYMDHPNESVQTMTMRTTDWLQTFNSTYGFLSQAITNLSGTTTVQATQGATPALGKTPDAIKQYGMNESARDEWDRFMMEETVNQLYERWLALITHKLDMPITMRIFGHEIQELEKQYPEEKDILDVFDSKNRGNVSISKKHLNDKDEIVKYDFELDSDSMTKKPQADPGDVAEGYLKLFIESPTLLQEVRSRGKDVDIAELLKRSMINDGLKDWDKIITDLKTGTVNGANPASANQPQLPPGIPPQIAAMMQGGQGQPGQTPASQPKQPNESINFKDLPPDGQQQMAQQAGINIQPQPQQPVPPNGVPVQGQPVVPNGAVPQNGQVPQGEPQPQQPGVGGIKDPLIAHMAANILGGIQGIPPTK